MVLCCMSCVYGIVLYELCICIVLYELCICIVLYELCICIVLYELCKWYCVV